MLRYEKNEDGMYNAGFRIFDADTGGLMYADTHYEADAIEIVRAVNLFRKPNARQ